MTRLAKAGTRLAVGLLALGLFSTPLVQAPVAHAQDAQRRQGAAAAFDRGTAAFLDEDYATAARWFEMANNLAPAAPALLQAIRSHAEAGNRQRAGTLALRLIARFPDADASITEAQAIIDSVRADYVLVEVTCDAECAVELDGTLQSHPAFFLEPDRDYEIGAGFDSGTVTESVAGDAGEQRTLHLVRPEGPVLVPDTTPPEGTGLGQGSGSGSGSTGVASSDPESGGVSPALFYVGLALTVGAGATLAWSGVDTLNAADEYEQTVAAGDITTARAMLDDGQKKELRTNVLIGVTAGLAALTVVFAIIADFGGDNEESEARLRPVGGVAFGASRGGHLGLEGRF